MRKYSQLWPNNLHPDRSEAAARECLKRLRLAKVDLLLAHMPVAKDVSKLVKEQ